MLRSLVVFLFLSTWVQLYAPLSYGQTPSQFAIFGGTETTSAIDSTDLNQSAEAMKWSSSSYDPSFFSHSVSSFSHEVTVNSFGNYKLSLTVPLTLTNTSSNRRQVVAEVYVNGVAVSHGRAASSYIRQASGHSESSLHNVVLLENLQVNDKISVYFSQGAFTGQVITTGAQMVLEYIEASRFVFTGLATQTTSSTNLNQSSAASLEWTDSIVGADFTHSNASSPENITLSAGDYMVYVNVPFSISGTCSNRNNLRVSLRLNGSLISGGQAAQGYIRCFENHDSSSVHWAGLVSGVTAGQTLTVQTQAETTVTENAIISPGTNASIFIEKVSTASEVISLTGTTVLSGVNWNSNIGSEVQWSSSLVNDPATFTHSTASNNHIITLVQEGDYYLVYNDHMAATLTRGNNTARIKVNGAVVNGAECKTHYIRNTTGHNESSCSLTYYLQSLDVGDQIAIEQIRESVSGTIGSSSPAKLTLVRVGPSSGEEVCENIIDCTPNRVLHYDGQSLNSVFDDQNRQASDLSFDGNVAQWDDISGSPAEHNGTQTSSASEPTFNTVTSGATFDGNDYLNIANHADLNLGTLKEKSIVTVFKTGADVTTPQVVYEEGGTVRGMNVYIRAGNLYLAFWNLANDGDGSQAFTFASTPINPNTFYYSSVVIDYSNYTGPTGPDGELRGHINGVAFSSLGTTTSLLYPHAGAIALGGMINDTYFDTGATSGNGHYFNGEIYEFIIYNYAIDNTEAVDFYNFLSDKWPDPQPITNLNLTEKYTTSSSVSPEITWTASVSPDVNDYRTGVGTTPGATDIQGWVSQGNVTSVNISGLTLSQCVDYYATVKARDSGGDESTEQTTEFFRFDGISPSDPSAIVVSGVSSTTTSKVFTWSISSDDCDFAGYDVSLGTAAGLSDVVAWQDIGNTATYTFTEIAPALSLGVDYFFNIRAKDQAGNLSSEISSSAWQVDTCVATDTLNPSSPGAISLSGAAGPTKTPTQSWSESTDACGLSHYEMAVGTTSGGSDISSYANIGLELSYTLFDISPSLSTNTNYYTSLRAVDLAGNLSPVVTSVAWQLPSPGNVSLGLSLWLDASDSSTLFADGSCLSPATVDNTAINCWLDKSPALNNGSVSGGAPTFQTNEFNGQSVVRFDGVNDTIDFPSINNARTIFVINKSNSASYQQILGHSSNQNLYTNNDTLIDTTLSSSNARNGSWRVDRVDVGGATSFSQTGSFSLISLVTTGNIAVDHIASDRKTGGRFFNGDVVEVIIYDRALSSVEVTSVENYLYDKWFTANPSAVTDLAFSTPYTATSSESPTFTWSHSISADLDHYEVALGTSAGSNNISGWTNIGLVNSYKFLGTSLTECQDVFASVRSVDTDGYVSSFESTQAGKFDQSPPATPVGLTLSGVASPTASQNISWVPATDNCSEVNYEVALVDTVGSTNIIDWTASTEANYVFSSISPDLNYATDYHFSVRSVDEAGNISAAVDSPVWQLESCIGSDVTPPTDPSGLSLSGVATFKESKSMAWSASTDVCSFDHYELAIGSSSGASDIQAWTNVGTSTSYQFLGLSPNLSFLTNYYLSVRAVDSAGNNSNVVSSSAWQLNSPGDVSATGLALWIDANDINTLYQDNSCSTTSVTSDNQGVLCVQDKSGNGNNATNASAANSPVYRSSLFNSKPSLYFDGGLDQYLNFNSSISNIRTVFWVIKEDNSNFGNSSFLLGDSQGTTFDFHRDSTGGPIFSSANASASVTGGTLQSNTVAIDGTTTNMPTSETVLSLVTTGNVTADSFSRDRVSCCGERTWGGFASEVIIFDRALSASEVTDVENYLLVKWGISSDETTWLGTTNTDWFLGSNWSDGVPTASSDCIIPDQSNDPIINGTGVCRSVSITNGHVTLQSTTDSTLVAYGDFSNSGTVTYNDGQLELRDDGLSSSDQVLSSVTPISELTFSKTAGGTVTVGNVSMTIDNLTIPGGSIFDFTVGSGKTLNLTTGLNQAGGTFDLQSGGTVNVSAGQIINVTGGTFEISGANDFYPQSVASKGQITSGGRWGFQASAGSVALTGFILDNLDVNGLQITGTANLTAFDGGQFTNLLNDFATPVRALVLDTTSSLTETLASNIGFSWSAANATYSGLATPVDDYFLVHANNCNGSALVFDQWFGDFWGTSPDPDLEGKIFDNADGGNCQISMSISASPVHLLSFNGQAYDEGAVLEWETGSELNHLGFNVYRSTSFYGNYEQINQEMIRNFVNTTLFKGEYRYTDTGLTNNIFYYYMIEDIAMNGERVLHGPVSVLPSSLYEEVPVDRDPDGFNEVVDGSVTPVANTEVVNEESEVLIETDSALRLRISPSTLALANADWNASYKTMVIPGYGHTLAPGEPELLYRRFLVEVDNERSGVSSQEVSVSYVDHTALLAGDSISPAPHWALNGSTNLLEKSYTPDSATYSLNQWLPAQSHFVHETTLNLNGKNFIQVDVWPIRYNPVTQNLEQFNELIIDIELEENGWEPPQVIGDIVPQPEAVGNNLVIEFNKTGVYELRYNDLQASNLEAAFVNISLAELRLYHKGVEIPLEINSSDGLFNSGDTLRFYAEYTETLDSNRDQVVLSSLDLRQENDIDLDFDGPLRIEAVDNQVQHSSVASSEFYFKTQKWEENLFAIFDVPLGSMTDHIFWQRVIGTGGSAPDGGSHHTVPVDLSDLHNSNSEEVVIHVELRGRGVFTLNPSHNLGLYLNGNLSPVAINTFAGTETQIVSYRAPAYQFLQGINSLQFTNLATDINTGDFSLIDINSVEVIYPAGFKAVDDEILISNRKPGEQINISGFSTDQLKIYDVSHRYESLIYQNFSVNPFNGQYLLQFDSTAGYTGQAGQKFLVIEDGQYLTPASLSLTYGSQKYLKSVNSNADYIMIAPRAVLGAVEELAQYRLAQGLSVDMVAVEQIYAEFSHGRVSSEAIRQYIQYVRENSVVAPRYVLIVGDATYDPKGDLNAYGLSQMPVPILSGLQMDYGSDNYFVESTDSFLPQLAIGRIPTSDEVKIRTYIEKLIKYESGLLAPTNPKTSQFISGLDTINENYDGDIDALSTTLLGENGSFSSSKLTLADFSDDADKKLAIQNSFEQDSFITTYYGHGAENIWGGGNIFSHTDAEQLQNEKLPIVVALNCLNTHFYDLDNNTISMGESFILNENGGAIAFWGSTSQTSPMAQLNLATSFLSQVASTTNQTVHDVRLGDIILQAKQSQGLNPFSEDTVRSWTLFGDPALKLPESAFADQPQASPNLEVAGNSFSGGGCQVLAASNGLSRDHLGWVAMEFFFLLLPLLTLFILRRFFYS